MQLLMNPSPNREYLHLFNPHQSIITIVINSVSVLDFVCVKVSQLFQTMQWGVDEMWILGDGKFFRI